MDNLANACGGCNGCKYNKTHAPDPLTNDIVPLYNPRTQKWEEHFTWSKDFLHIIGITPIGRATEKALKLNRSGVVNLRRLFILEGIHPPKD